MPEDHTPQLVSRSRRRLLQRVGIGLVSPVLLPLAGNATARHSVSAKIRSCIFVFLYGGPSHLDTFDMKPTGPAAIRGEFRPIATRVPGLQVCEHLPQLAKVMHHFAVVRSLHHSNRLHDSAGTELFTGRQGPKGDREEFAAIPQFFPCHGSALHYVRRDRPLELQHAILPWLFHNVIDVPCQGGGFLGKAYDPLLIKGDANSRTFRVDALRPKAGLPATRIARRKNLLSRFDSRKVIESADAKRLNNYYDRAYELLESKRLRDSLDMNRESQTTRKRYGLGANGTRGGGNGAGKAYGRNLRGQSLLLARRLVEAGVPFVNVNDYRQQGQNWDSHADNFGQHRKYLLPAVDQGLSALIEDLDERGLLNSTLVVVAGEFGRTPKINKNGGRDHWPDCFSILLAGGGIRGGQIYGASDKSGAYPDRDPVTPADLSATIFDRFGVSPRTEIHDATGRPYRLSDGRPLTSLFG